MQMMAAWRSTLIMQGGRGGYGVPAAHFMRGRSSSPHPRTHFPTTPTYNSRPSASVREPNQETSNRKQKKKKTAPTLISTHTHTNGCASFAGGVAVAEMESGDAGSRRRDSCILKLSHARTPSSVFTIGFASPFFFLELGAYPVFSECWDDRKQREGYDGDDDDDVGEAVWMMMLLCGDAKQTHTNTQTRDIYIHIYSHPHHSHELSHAHSLPTCVAHTWIDQWTMPRGTFMTIVVVVVVVVVLLLICV